MWGEWGVGGGGLRWEGLWGGGGGSGWRGVGEMGVVVDVAGVGGGYFT